MRSRFLFRARLRLHRWYAAAKGWRIYALALLLSVPDILDALVGVDLTPLLPPGSATKVAALLAIARVVLGITIRRLPPPAPPAGGPR